MRNKSVINRYANIINFIELTNFNRFFYAHVFFISRARRCQYNLFFSNCVIHVSVASKPIRGHLEKREVKEDEGVKEPVAGHKYNKSPNQ